MNDMRRDVHECRRVLDPCYMYMQLVWFELFFLNFEFVCVCVLLYTCITITKGSGTWCRFIKRRGSIPHLYIQGDEISNLSMKIQGNIQYLTMASSYNFMHFFDTSDYINHLV